MFHRGFGSDSNGIVSAETEASLQTWHARKRSVVTRLRGSQKRLVSDSLISRSLGERESEGGGRGERPLKVPRLLRGLGTRSPSAVVAKLPPQHPRCPPSVLQADGYLNGAVRGRFEHGRHGETKNGSFPDDHEFGRIGIAGGRGVLDAD